MAKKVDTVIIGGGVGGTALGALLASGGQRVILVDKNDIIGGRCTSYKRDGFVVDLGVHLFGLGDKGPLGEVCRRVGEPDAIEWISSPVFGIPMYYRGKIRGFIRQMVMKTGQMRDVGALIKILYKVIKMSDEELNALWYTSLSDWLSGFTTNQPILSNFSLLCGIFLCIGPDVASAAEFILALRGVLRSKSSGYPKGGCVSIPMAYQRIIENHGGEVHLGCPAEKIIIEDARARGVIAGGKTILAEQVVSNADIKATIGGLAATDHFPSDYVERIQKLTYTSHVVSLKVALNKKITNHKMIMYMPDLSDEEIEELKKKYIEGKPMPMLAGGMINSPTNFDPDLAPTGKQIIFFGSRCERRQDWEKWGKILLNTLCEVFPGIENHILWSTIDSPDDIEAYALEDGNIIGIGQTVDQIHQRRPTQETPVDGLYLCGAEAGGHGIGTELAVSSAIELSEKLL